MTFLLLKIFLAVLCALLFAGIAVNASPKLCVLDGLRVILIALSQAIDGILDSPDFWEAMKAFFGSLMLSGAVMYSLASGADASTLPMDTNRGATAVGFFIGFIGVAYSSRKQRHRSSSVKKP